jgi:hypothetical protein
VPAPRRHRPRPHLPAVLTPAPRGGSPSRLLLDRRSTDPRCRGWESSRPPHRPGESPTAGRGRPPGAAPPPGWWPVALGFGRGMFFDNPVVRSHTRQASAQCGSGIVHPRTWTLQRIARGSTFLVWGRYSGARERRETRGVPNRMGSWAAPRRGRVGGHLSSRGMTRGGAGSAWSSS